MFHHKGLSSHPYILDRSTSHFWEPSTLDPKAVVLTIAEKMRSCNVIIITLLAHLFTLTTAFDCILGPLSPPVVPWRDLCTDAIIDMVSTLPIGQTLHFSSFPNDPKPLPPPWFRGDETVGRCGVGLHWYRQPREADVMLATLGTPASRIFEVCMAKGEYRGCIEVLGGVMTGSVALTMRYFPPESPVESENGALFNETELTALALNKENVVVA